MCFFFNMSSRVIGPSSHRTDRSRCRSTASWTGPVTWSPDRTGHRVTWEEPTAHWHRNWLKQSEVFCPFLRETEFSQGNLLLWVKTRIPWLTSLTMNRIDDQGGQPTRNPGSGFWSTPKSTQLLDIILTMQKQDHWFTPLKTYYMFFLWKSPAIFTPGCPHWTTRTTTDSMSLSGHRPSVG